MMPSAPRPRGGARGPIPHKGAESGIGAAAGADPRPRRGKHRAAPRFPYRLWPAGWVPRGERLRELRHPETNDTPSPDY